MSQDDWAWFAARVRMAVVDINTEHRMAVQVKALADIVRNAKAAIDAANGAATRLHDSATQVTNTIAAVSDMTSQLDAANADLTAALGVMTNGGPPLVTTASSVSSSPVAASPTETIESSITKVQTANANMPAPPAYVAPPVVTASTIAAANAAAANTTA